MEAHFATVWEDLADDQPDALALAQGERELRWGEYDDRAARLAAALLAAGVGPGDTVALYLRNALEYAELTYAALKIRAIPVNVNYRYLGDELLELLDDSQAKAVAFHSDLAPRIAAVADRARDVHLWIQVDPPAAMSPLIRPRQGSPGNEPAHSTSGDGDGAGEVLLGAVGYDELLAAHEPAARITRDGDDRWVLYTGGTTGRPRGVVYRIETLVTRFLAQLPQMLGLDPVTEPAGARALARRLRADGAPYVALPACPLMHGIGQWRGVLMPHLIGGTGILLPDGPLDAPLVWRTIADRRVVTLVVVGDAVARPLAATLESTRGRPLPATVESAGSRRLDSTPATTGPRHPDSHGPAAAGGTLRFMFSSGTMLSAEVKSRFLARIPGLTIVDAFGASEASAGIETSTAGSALETGRFVLNPNVRVFDEHDRHVLPRSGGRGRFAAFGDIPLGYHRDEAKTAEVFRIIDGVRYSIPGDWVHLREDGAAIFLGRDSSCINTGGEKVFPEEVEEVLKTHPEVADALVIGVPDERFGSRVAAVVAPVAAGAHHLEAELLTHVRERLAGYKVPIGVAFVASIPRHDHGKPDHNAARALWDRRA